LVVFFVETGKHLRALTLDLPDATSCFLPLHRREDPPGDSPTCHATPPPSFFLPARSSSFSPCLLTVAGALRLATLFRTPPCSSEKLRRSPTPPSSSSPEESSRSARNHRGFLAGPELVAAQNSSPPALLRTSRPRRSVPGELLVRPGPSPLCPSRRIAVPGRPSPVPGSRSGWATP
jgi:hypothetical protein